MRNVRLRCGACGGVQWTQDGYADGTHCPLTIPGRPAGTPGSPCEGVLCAEKSKDIAARDRKDPVDALVLNLTPKEFVDWLVEYKGLDPLVAENVEMNLREQFRWHRLQGRLDQGGFFYFLACLLGLYRSVRSLEKPIKPTTIDDVPPVPRPARLGKRA